MSLIHREPRLEIRDRPQQVFRDDRLFLIACEDRYAPAQYFAFLAVPRVTVIVSTAGDMTCAAEATLTRLLTDAKDMDLQPDDQLWLVLDTDHMTQGTHLRAFTSALRRARASGVKVALSHPCFDLWLLLHQIEETELPSINDCADVASLIRAKVGEFNKTKLKAEHYSPGSATLAAVRAKRLDASVGGGEIPISTTTRVYKLFEAILSKSLPSEMPLELQNR